ncbi:MAG TPA: hypothetical protein VEQ34_03695 [Pyrinomonadaceae bacterium]|nr:hypothetical protein [Pyrinomonadaceae bacterium]
MALSKMKKILIVIFTVAVFALGGCNSNPQDSSGKIFSVKGKVTEIERGRDGYTAKIKTDDDKIYSAVISSVTLGAQYRDVKIGDVIEVEDKAYSGGNRLTVSALK